MDQNTMKKIGREMSILMSIAVSLTLSLCGTLLSGHFTIGGFLLSFAVSLAISLVIGLLVPMKPLCDRIEQRCGIRPNTIPARLLETLVSDLLYTPIITTVMTVIAYKQATAHGASIPFVPMLLRSLLISLAVGYVVIMILTPLFMKLVLNRHGIGAPPARRDHNKQ